MFHLRTHGASERRGFTLIELLIVILIISVLIAVGLAVGTRVIAGGKTSQTRDLLKTLDNVLNSYEQATDRSPPASIVDPRLAEGTVTGTIIYFPVADAVDESTGVPINSVGLFLAEARRVAGVSNLLEGLDTRNFREFAYTASPDPAPGATEPLLPTVLDAWGNPIRFVHPAFHGVRRSAEAVVDVLGPVPSPGTAYFPTDIRRDPAMSDGDGGLTTNSRPYFYSAGPDGDPSTIEDNVYLVEPKIQN
ncbi:MAG: prepilin-type N-terminal cleavage/methylation domain-containing protein [Phycisphaerales bacterium]|jgi:prepilin-type N-terminal cleavage/methylation domain-containing protein